MYDNKVTVAKLLFNKQIIKTCVIVCQFGESQKTSIYLARQKKKKQYFLFGITNDTDIEFPKLLAVVVNYMDLNRLVVQQNHFLKLFSMYNDCKYSDKIYFIIEKQKLETVIESELKVNLLNR